jgi:hexosaminidase
MFEYRGFMLDSVRHMQSIEEIKKLIDTLPLLKINKFHWHLTDDQGWRFESERFPQLNSAAERPYSDFGKTYVNEPHGKLYTKDEMREIVAYCAERGIEVVPEFDIPGHTSALLHAYPHLSCNEEPIEVKTCQGIFTDILCAGKDETFETVFDILADIIEIFPSEYIHIGGDEAPKKRWKECPDCQKRIKDEGLRNEEELQGWFTNKVVEFLESRGRKAIVWNESLKSGLVKNSLVQMWMDRKKDSVAYANKGGKIIVSDFFHYYCDYPYGMTPLKKTYNYDPILKGIKNKNSVVGVEAPIWTEYINNFDHLCYMCFPRFTAVAETGWTEKENKNADDFCRRFEKYSAILTDTGITPAPASEWNPPLLKKLKIASFILGLLDRS